MDVTASFLAGSLLSLGAAARPAHRDPGLVGGRPSPPRRRGHVAQPDWRSTTDGLPPRVIFSTSHIRAVLVPLHEAREAVDAFLARAEREARGVPGLEPELRLRRRGAAERRPRRAGALDDRARVPQRPAVLAHDAHRPALRHGPHQEARVAVEVEAAVLAVVGRDQRDRHPMALGVDREKIVRRRRRLSREREGDERQPRSRLQHRRDPAPRPPAETFLANPHGSLTLVLGKTGTLRREATMQGDPNT